MINFRYHVISLIAVFLALGIGVIMGSAVIDRAIVDRLEDQQAGLERQIEEVEGTNDQLREENRELRETADQLTEEGSQRLLAGSLTDVPVLVVATRGVDDEGFQALLSLLGTSGADQRGTLWLTDRFALDDEDEVRDLAEAIDAPESLDVDRLRSLALTRLSTVVREQAGSAAVDPEETVEGEGEGEGEVVEEAPTGEEPEVESETAAEGEEEAADTSVLLALRDAGFLDFDGPEGGAAEDGPKLAAGTRIVLVSGPNADVAPELVAVPLAGLLVDERPNVPSVAVLAAEARPGAEEPAQEFVVLIRQADDVASRLSTVDNIDDFPGRLAAVLALVDLGEGRVGHFGRGPGAQRLLPAPPESDG